MQLTTEVTELELPPSSTQNQFQIQNLLLWNNKVPQNILKEKPQIAAFFMLHFQTIKT